MSTKHRRARGAKESSLRLRLVAFVGLAILIVGAAGWLLWPRPAPASTASRAVEITMAGFRPNKLVVPSGQPITVRLVNPDSPFHTDGGGMHQFAAPELGVDVVVQPRSSMEVTIPAAAPGTYAFYCDSCCGGKESPAMQGTIVVS
ncbi:MAG: cupredoxin domain-containing protein [Chloroflexi bacterium]|nr:cupredoxin domain-containing protein [Chloroflexota bacterium]